MPEPLQPDEINELANLVGGEGGGEAAPPPPQAPTEDVGPAPSAPKREAGMELLDDVNVNVRVELGRSRVVVQDVLKLAPGSVVPLDTLTGDPLDVYVNDRLVARGEVLVVNDNFALRITEVLPQPKSGA